MSSNSESELVSFHRFVADQIQHGSDNVSPEEALDLWRATRPAADDFEETVSAVREALQDMAEGDCGVAFERFDHEFRERRKL